MAEPRPFLRGCGAIDAPDSGGPRSQPTAPPSAAAAFQAGSGGRPEPATGRCGCRRPRRRAEELANWIRNREVVELKFFAGSPLKIPPKCWAYLVDGKAGLDHCPGLAVSRTRPECSVMNPERWQRVREVLDQAIISGRRARGISRLKFAVAILSCGRKSNRCCALTRKRAASFSKNPQPT